MPFIASDPPDGINPAVRRIFWGFGILAAAGLLGAVIVPLVPLIVFLNSIPPTNWDVVQWKGSDCQLTDHRPRWNHNGFVAVFREANCPGPLAQGTYYHVIFVHSSSKPNTRDNMAFQYTPSFSMNPPFPMLTWTGPSELTIRVRSDIDGIEIKKNEVDGIAVTYKL